VREGDGAKIEIRTVAARFYETNSGGGLYFDGGDPFGVGESVSEVVGGSQLGNAHEGRGWGQNRKSSGCGSGLGNK
jgi:hypothetical protein